MSRYRVVYFGTPQYAVPALRALHSDDRFDVVLVVTQPDRPAGRGHRLVAPAVKLAALELELPVYQPQSLRTLVNRQPLLNANPDIFIVAAFGLIFGEKTLAIPRYGALNLHASLLPAFRGANPIAAAIASGNQETGVSLMRMERGLDSGPVIAKSTIAIASDDTTESLTLKLADCGAELLIVAIGGYLNGEVVPEAQPPNGVTLARPMRKSDGEIDWNRSSETIDRHVRAMWPWPRAWTRFGDVTIQIHEAREARDVTDLPPARVEINERVLVGTGEGAIELVKVQFPGKSAVDAISAARGGMLVSGQQFEPAALDRDPLVQGFSVADSTTA